MGSQTELLTLIIVCTVQVGSEDHLLAWLEVGLIIRALPAPAAFVYGALTHFVVHYTATSASTSVATRRTWNGITWIQTVVVRV
jgi:hypothetical protein